MRGVGGNDVPGECDMIAAAVQLHPCFDAVGRRTFKFGRKRECMAFGKDRILSEPDLCCERMRRVAHQLEGTVDWCLKRLYDPCIEAGSKIQPCGTERPRRTQ